MTQNEQILEHLQSGERLSPLQALRLYGVFRLGARIWDLKRLGHDIKMELIEVGDGKHVAEYWLPRKPRFPVEPSGQMNLLGAA